MENKTVLIVDDDALMRDLLSRWFTGQGYDCTAVPDAGKAMEFLEDRPFDLMVTDVRMPGMRGLELTERARLLRPDMLIIVMTGYSEDFSYDEAIQAGASDFIKKPFTLQELMVRIRQARMREEFRVQSLVDELTGLYNRRGFMTLAEHQLKVANRNRKGLFLLYADLDGLKAINDAYGHHEGDKVLVEMAQILKENYRESDIVARVGGDEFVVFPLPGGGTCVETMTARLEENLMRHAVQQPREYTWSVSYGISFYDPDRPCSLEELIDRADRLMYHQKRRKQN